MLSLDNFSLISKRCQRVLEEENGDMFPIAHIFDCSHLQGVIEGPHVWLCTGQNLEIFKSVWQHPDMPALVRKVVRSYDDHNRSRLQSAAFGANYRAAFFCHTGNHRSVAVAIGFATMLNDMPEFKGVQIDVKHSNEIMHRRLCCGECCYCEKSIMREALELDLVRSAYKMAFP